MVGDVTGAATPASDAPPPTPKADWAKPETCLCADHLPLVLVDAGADIPACVKCARVREWGEKKRAESAVAARAAQRSDADRAASCSWHDEAGWVVDPATGAPFEHPAVHCDHTSTSPETVQAAIDARRQAAAPSSTEEGRARARAIAQQKRLSGSETPAPAPGVTPPSATARKRPVRAAGRVVGGAQHRSPTLEPAAAT